MTKEKKQLTYKSLYRIFSAITYALVFLIFLLGTSIVNSDSPTLSNVTIAVLAFTMIWGVIAAICLSVKKAKESNKQI
jgi:hypothetical protein